MNHDPDLDSMLSYVAGIADADEALRAEQRLSAGSPAAAAAYAEALAIFNAIPLGLTPVTPPASVRQAILGRVAADVSSRSRSPDLAGRLRWPIYASTGLAAALAVALTVTLWNNSVLNTRTNTLSSSLAQLQDQNRQMSTTLAGSQQLMRSPTLSMVSLSNQDKSGPRPSGRVLFCPVSRLYQVTVFDLAPLPPGRGYELWLITPDQRKIPAGMLTVDERGVATVMAHPDKVDVAAVAAVTDEPAGGSAVPTGAIHLAGALQPTN